MGENQDIINKLDVAIKGYTPETYNARTNFISDKKIYGQGLDLLSSVMNRKYPNKPLAGEIINTFKSYIRTSKE